MNNNEQMQILDTEVTFVSMGNYDNRLKNYGWYCVVSGRQVGEITRILPYDTYHFYFVSYDQECWYPNQLRTIADFLTQANNGGHTCI